MCINRLQIADIPFLYVILQVVNIYAFKMETQIQNLLIKRRSYRKFADELLTPEETQHVLEAALLSPTSKNKHSWEFIAVENKETLNKLAVCKPNSATFIADAALAVVVIGNPLLSDVWIEDASLAAINMQLQAEDLGLGSCWVQVRGRMYSDTISTSEYICDLLAVPNPLEVLCILVFGRKQKERTPNQTEELLWEKVHVEKYK